jgi:hemerythrin-like domain-containing protein
MSINPRYITNAEGKTTDVVLTMQEFNDLIEEMEDREDIAAYEKAKREIENGEDEVISFEQMKAELKALGKID